MAKFTGIFTKVLHTSSTLLMLYLCNSSPAIGISGAIYFATYATEPDVGAIFAVNSGYILSTV